MRAREPGRVWAVNWTIACVFLDCRWTLVLGIGGAYYQGISAREIDAACRLHTVRRSERQAVLQGVRVMEAAAQPILNERKTNG